MTDIIAVLEKAKNLGLDISESQAREFEDFVLLVRSEARKECWDEVNNAIQPGNLPGNGTDKSAERNGLVLAANIIAGLKNA